ncbi:MAG TPA: hypothetical protein DCZ89_11065, partial [Geobacter sulfurreducens]|nr:hypothetical protein [Geobacter sulfurreducens]
MMKGDTLFSDKTDGALGAGILKGELQEKNMMNTALAVIARGNLVPLSLGPEKEIADFADGSPPATI